MDLRLIRVVRLVISNKYFIFHRERVLDTTCFNARFCLVRLLKNGGFCLEIIKSPPFQMRSILESTAKHQVKLGPDFGGI